jgi:hypothetical protein
MVIVAVLLCAAHAGALTFVTVSVTLAVPLERSPAVGVYVGVNVPVVALKLPAPLHKT